MPVRTASGESAVRAGLVGGRGCRPGVSAHQSLEAKAPTRQGVGGGKVGVCHARRGVSISRSGCWGGVFEVPAVNAAQMREVHRIAMEETGPNLFQMMENAGRNLAYALEQPRSGPPGALRTAAFPRTAPRPCT